MKRKSFFIIGFLILLFIMSCNNNKISQKLTLEVVQKLSGKGDKLSWKDFQVYESKEVGSGLHILEYQIDDKYALYIGGDFKEKPMYMNLVYNYNALEGIGVKYIDIRYDNVDKFLKSVP